MGGLARKLPHLETMLIATVAISGLPPFSGFFSKDEILAGAFFAGKPAIFALGLVGSALTAFYMCGWSSSPSWAGRESITTWRTTTNYPRP